MRRVLCMVLSALILCIAVAGCSIEVQESSESGGEQYAVYYINKEETKVLGSGYSPEQETADYLIKDFISMLNERDHPGNGQPLLPEEVQIETFRIHQDVLELTFNRAYSSISRAREILTRAGVVRTFVQIPGITGVKFYVGSAELMDSRGQAIGEMKASDFVELWGSSQDAYRYDTFTLYFTDKTGEKLVAETRNVYYKRNLSRERVILEQLAKGPMTKGHYPTIPENTEVVSVTTADRNCYVDFSSVFKDGQLDISENTMIYSVANTLLSVANADKVQISVAGKTEETLRDGTSLYNLFGWNDALIVEEPEETKEQ